MFSQFFEKKKTAGYGTGYYAKKSKRSSSPNDSNSSLMRYFQGKSSSPTTHKIRGKYRRESPFMSPRAVGKISYGKLLNLNHLRIRQS